MNSFVLATVRTADGPAPALGLLGSFYLVADVCPSLARRSVKDLLQDWPSAFKELERSAGVQPDRPAVQAQLLTPVMYPDTLLAVGANYADHLLEMGLPPERWSPMPYFFRSPAISLVGPGSTVRIPRSTKQFDWECELAVVLGRTLRHATPSEVSDAIAGYSIGLDMSCRDLIPLANDLKVDLCRGKAQDTMAPCGPYLVPKEFIGDPDSLEIGLWLNGERMMRANTAQMIYKVPEILSILSEFHTLMPGDIIFTGSPSGSAAHHGGKWLKPGDTLRAQIGPIGPFEVSMVADEAKDANPARKGQSR